MEKNYIKCCISSNSHSSTDGNQWWCYLLILDRIHQHLYCGFILWSILCEGQYSEVEYRIAQDARCRLIKWLWILVNNKPSSYLYIFFDSTEPVQWSFTFFKLRSCCLNDHSWFRCLMGKEVRNKCQWFGFSNHIKPCSGLFGYIMPFCSCNQWLKKTNNSLHQFKRWRIMEANHKWSVKRGSLDRSTLFIGWQSHIYYGNFFFKFTSDSNRFWCKHVYRTL